MDIRVRELTRDTLVGGEHDVQRGGPFAIQLEETTTTNSQATATHLARGVLLRRDAPAEVDLVEVDVDRGAVAADGGEGVLDQVFPLPLHVGKGGGDKEADRPVLPRRLQLVLDLSLDVYDKKCVGGGGLCLCVR